MKCVKKLVAVLLTAVMAMSLLTACGGGSSGGAGNGIVDKTAEVTDVINAELKKQGSDIQVTYDKETEQKLKAAYSNYVENLKGISNPTEEQEDQAMSAAFQAAGVPGNHLWGTRSFSSSSDVQRVATSIAAAIKKSADKNNRNYKKIAYATLLDAAGQPYEMWYLVLE